MFNPPPEPISEERTGWNWVAFFFTWVWALWVGLKAQGLGLLGIYLVIWVVEIYRDDLWVEEIRFAVWIGSSLIYGYFGEAWKRKRGTRGR